jgi:hypothetical protein
VLGEQERTGQQQPEQGVPAVLGELGDRGNVLEAGVGHHDVEAAEVLQRGVHRLAVAVAGDEVGANGTPGPSGAGSRSTARTSSPSSLSAWAIARPMPPAAPVTSAARRSAAAI